MLDTVQAVKFIVNVLEDESAGSPSKVVEVFAALLVRLPDPEQVPLIAKLFEAPFAVKARYPDCIGKLNVEEMGPVGPPPPPPPHAAKRTKLVDRTNTLLAKR